MKDTERVKSIFWFERDPWGRYIKWSGDGQAMTKQDVQLARHEDGSLLIDELFPPHRVSAAVFHAALQRAMKSKDTVIVTDIDADRRA